MTERQHKAASRYIRRLADELRLRDWTVELGREAAKDGASATVGTIYGRRLANIRLADTFYDESAETQRHSIVHELVHLHLEPASSMVIGDLYEALGKRADKLFENVYRRHLEYAVDHLADAIAPLLPLPPWRNDA